MPEGSQDEERELSAEEIEALLAGAAAKPEATPAATSAATRPVQPLPAPPAEAAAEPLPEFETETAGQPLLTPENLVRFLGDVPLEITIELGRAELSIGELISLRQGTVVQLDKLAGEPVDILANGTLIARGEVVMVNDYFSVRVTEIVPEGETAE